MRVFVVACISGALLALVAAPVFAQRDPFVPVVRDEALVTTTAETQDGVVTFQPRRERRPTDPVPETGAEVAPWLTVVYILGALGAGAIVVARSFGPQTAPRRG